MDTRQLAAFCAVVERRSFSQAAEQLGVTQPAVSLQIRSLEKRLGLQLVDRSGRRVEPTEAGRRLYRSAQRRLALGLQESARSAVIGGFGVTFISRSAIDADVAAGTVAVARVDGLEPSREISLVRSAGRAETRVAQAFVEFAKSRLA